MKCQKCKAEIPDESLYCMHCGKKLSKWAPSKRKRGNGQGSVYQLPNGKWRCEVVLGYYLDAAGKLKKKTVTKSTFKTKTDAANYVAKLQDEGGSKRPKPVTFKDLYDIWLPTHEASKSTLDCYKAAIKYFEPVWGYRIGDISVDDLQECIDECPQGKRTRQNMRSVCGLVYKYGIPRNLVPNGLNLAQYLKARGEAGAGRTGFTLDEVEKIKKGVDKTPYADYIYCMIYLGFRPSEFLALDARSYNRKERAFIGGAKTEAGTDRVVTVSPKIQGIINRLMHDKVAGPVFCTPNGERFNLRVFREDCFYPALEQLGIISSAERKLTPHCCRHTFATLMKGVQAPDKDKLAIIGHTSDEMLRHYQDVSYSDLRKITDAI